MFSQKKRFFKGKLFYVIIFGLFIFGVWLNQDTATNDPPNDVNTDTDYSVSTDGALSIKGKDDYNILDNVLGGQHGDALETSEYTEENDDNDANDNNSNNQKNSNTDCYLVKEVNGVIKVFYYDKTGKKKLIRDTDIAFSLLSTADQEFFRQGIIKNTKDELDELLQDFDS
ncbi:MAG: hypothetical protein PHE79_09885 [Eubacteriales bacterium]|nr:hypothetical protein [Eubacteriales bacterium]